MKEIAALNNTLFNEIKTAYAREIKNYLTDDNPERKRTTPRFSFFEKALDSVGAAVDYLFNEKGRSRAAQWSRDLDSSVFTVNDLILNTIDMSGIQLKYRFLQVLKEKLEIEKSDIDKVMHNLSNRSDSGFHMFSQIGLIDPEDLMPEDKKKIESFLIRETLLPLRRACKQEQEAAKRLRR